MKRCTGCRQDHPQDFFAWKNKKKQIRHKRCKNCTRAATKQHFLLHREKYDNRSKKAWKQRQKENQEKILQYLLAHPCPCGESDPVVLQFDHRDRTKKRKEISVMIRTYSWKTIEIEIAKCDVLCSNCHLRKTSKQFGYWKDRISKKPCPHEDTGLHFFSQPHWVDNSGDLY